MQWLSVNYPWFLTLVLMGIAAWWLKRRLDSLKKTTPESTLSAQGLSQPAAPPEPARVNAAPLTVLPNIIVTDARIVRVSQVESGVWSEVGPAQDAFIVQFANEVRKGDASAQAFVKAQLIYRDGVRELRRITGCWLDQAADMTEFRVGNTHRLLVGLMLGQRFNTIEKRRVRVAARADEIPQDITPLNSFEQGTVSVRLTHVATGEVLYEGQFQLNTCPPEITVVPHLPS